MRGFLLGNWRPISDTPMWLFAMVRLTNLLTDQEAADLLRLNVRRLRRMAIAGEVPSVDLGDGVQRFDPEDIRRFVDEHRRPAASRMMPAVAPA